MIDIESLVAKIRDLPEPMAREVNDFIDFLHEKNRKGSGSAPETAAHPIMLAFGLWHEERDLDDLTERIYANRRAQASRPEVSL